MGETSDQIERRIRETRNDLSENFSELEEKVRTAVDWRAQFDERPMTMIALAFGGGILLSALLPFGRSSRRRYSEARSTAPLDRNAPGVSIESRPADDCDAGQTVGTFNALKGALAGVAATRLSGFIEDLLPGFEQEFTTAQTGKSSDRSGSFSSGQPTWQKSTATRAD
jgi:hypothetical protein